MTKFHSNSDTEIPSRIEEQWTTALKTYMNGAKAKKTKKPDYTIYETGLDNPMWNQVVLQTLNTEKIGTQIEEIKSHFIEKDLPYTWFTGPKTQSNILNKYLEKHGLVEAYHMPGMSIDLGKISEESKFIPGFEVKSVLDDQTLDDYLGVLIACFSGILRGMEQKMPEVIKYGGLSETSASRHWVGYLDGEAVGSGAYILGHGVAGIYNIGTLESARRKGIGSEMTLIPLRDAKRRGYSVGVLHSSPVGKFVYEKLGFVEKCKMYAFRNP